MNWRIAQTKQKFSELINAALQEPQHIYNQNQLVAVVVEAKVFEKFLSWWQQREVAISIPVVSHYLILLHKTAIAS